MSLAELEGEFWRSVRTRGAPPPDLGRTFTASPRQSAAERLAVYHVAYWQRQLLALASTFTRLQSLLGERRFEQLALRYIERRPALHPCIERLGENFPDFLTSELNASEVGLARLEWANVACLLAPDAPGSVELPRELGPQFAMCRLKMIPAVLLVSAPASSVRAFDERLELPPHLDEAAVVFSRPSFAVRYATLEDDAARALTLAQEGQDVARICEAFSSRGEDAASRALEVLGGWFRKGWVAGVHLDPG
jgi:hypothetical protein